MDKIEERKTDKNFLASTIKIFQNSVDRDDEGNPVGECDSPVPDKAAEYLFRLEPSANAAKSLAGKYVREKNYNEAIKYIEEAIKLSSNNTIRLRLTNFYGVSQVRLVTEHLLLVPRTQSLLSILTMVVSLSSRQYA